MGRADKIDFCPMESRLMQLHALPFPTWHIKTTPEPLFIYTSAQQRQSSLHTNQTANVKRAAFLFLIRVIKIYPAPFAQNLSECTFFIKFSWEASHS